MLKVAHHNSEGLTPGERIVIAREYEQNGELEKAALVYEKVIRESKLNQDAYDRLMIIYRKLKEYSKEAAVIKKAIHAFEDLYDHDARKKPDKKVAALSKALNKMTGLADKKGQSLYDPEPLGKWKKRMKVVEKRLEGAEKK